LRIIADHARAATFLISDSVLPSNEGRGYVLRLIMRRALYHGQTLGLDEPFLYKLSGEVVEMMKSAYPELAQTAPHVARAIKTEEEQYARTTRIGLEKLDEARVFLFSDGIIPTGKKMTFGEYKALCKKESAVPVGVIMGEDLFKLHDTFGLRPDFVEDVVGNYGLKVGREDYNAEMDRQRERARTSWKGIEKKIAAPVYLELAEQGKTVFDGYTQTASNDCRIVALVVKGQAVKEVAPATEIDIILDHTPFYAEAGGQAGDSGFLFAPATEHELAHIKNTYHPVSGLIAHKAVARDTLHAGDIVTAKADAKRRGAMRRNHTATHLLHAALRQALGTHVKQAGSLVAPDRLRFDFTHYAALDQQDLLDIEDLVNQQVLANEEIRTEEMDVDAAVNSGAMALFGEKYGDRVRVVSVGDGGFSKELCGGTHVRRTGDIGLFKIISEGSVAAGTRRIEAVTGEGVLSQLRETSQTLGLLSDALHAKPEGLLQAVEKLAESEKKLRKELEAQQMKRAASQAGDLAKGARDVKGVRVVSARVEVTDRSAMRQMVDELRAMLQSGVIVLGSVSDGKVTLIAAVTKDLTGKLDAGKIVKQAAAIVEGGGGGRKDLAEAGGKNPAKLDESIQAVPSIIEKML
jgi:alanyl-tRNA synthetase